MKKNCLQCNKEFSKPYVESVKAWNTRHKFCSQKCKNDSQKGKPLKHSNIGQIAWNKGLPAPWSKGNKYREGIPGYWKGKIRTVKDRITMSKAHIGKNVGEDNPSWNGGEYSESRSARKNIEYRLWRESVYARDHWTCQRCQDNTGGNLNPHHILNFAKWIELRFAIDNGITLCTKCHNKFHKKYGTRNNTQEQLNEFFNSTVVA
jgi:hypothetical protein